MKDQDIQYNIFFRYLNNILNVLAFLVALSLLLIVLLQIATRSIGYPLPWTEELTRYMFVWMIFLGIGMGFGKVESPRVTIVYNVMPRSIKKLGRYIYIIGTVGFLSFMAWYGIELVQQQMNMNEKSSVLLLPVWIIGLCVPISGIIGILTTIQSLIYHKDLV